MLNRDLPKRTAFQGPPHRVYCDVPTEVIERYLEALLMWVPPERSSGAASSGVRRR